MSHSDVSTSSAMTRRSNNPGPWYYCLFASLAAACLLGGVVSTHYDGMVPPNPGWKPVQAEQRIVNTDIGRLNYSLLSQSQKVQRISQDLVNARTALPPIELATGFADVFAKEGYRIKPTDVRRAYLDDVLTAMRKVPPSVYLILIYRVAPYIDSQRLWQKLGFNHDQYHFDIAIDTYAARACEGETGESLSTCISGQKAYVRSVSKARVKISENHIDYAAIEQGLKNLHQQQAMEN